MAANITPLPQPRDRETAESQHLPDEIRDSAHPDAGVADESDARAIRRLVPCPRTLAMLGGGVAAALAGGMFGYWLGARRAVRAPARVRHAAATADSLVALAPVAASLLQNPMIRQLVLRLLLRQITSRLHV